MVIKQRKKTEKVPNKSFAIGSQLKLILQHTYISVNTLVKLVCGVS